MAASGPRRPPTSRPPRAAPATARPVVAHGFLFADIRGYTGYVEANGDHAGADLLGRYRSIVRRAVEAAAGAEIRTEGDSFFVAFDSASSAVACGLAIVDAARAGDRPGEAVAVGVGIHAGEAVETDEGYVGLAVNIAARLCGQAAAGEVVVSETVRSLARGSIDATFVPLGVRHLKGVDEPVAVFRAEGRSSGSDGFGPSRRVGLARGLPGAVVAVSGIAILAILGAVAWPLAGASQPVASDGASPSMVRPGVAAATDAGTEGQLTPTELALLERIPLEFQPYCDRSTAEDGAAGGLASLRCDLRDAPGYGADTVWYDAFDPSSRGDMAVVMAEIANREGVAAVEGGTAGVVAACVEPAGEAIGRWDFYTTFAGRLACYRRDGEAWLAWTYEGQDILARAVRLDGDAGRLVEWWDDRAAPYLR